MYYKELKKRVQECAKLKVPITRHDRLKFNDVFQQNPQGFTRNCTELFFKQMKIHIRNGKVWRINCSGKTRHGKTEVSQTWTMLHIDEWNKALKDGCFKELESQGVKYKQEKLSKLRTDEILFSKSNYLYNLREQVKKNNYFY